MKNKFRMLIAVLLTLAMVFSLCACGKKNKGPEAVIAAEGTAVPVEETPEPTPTPAPVYEYAAEFTQIGTGANYVNTKAFTGNGFYTVSWSGDSAESAKPVISFVGTDGSIRALSAYVPMQASSNVNGWNDFSSASNLEGIALNGDSIVTIESVFSSGSVYAEAIEGAENANTEYKYARAWFIRTLDGNGNELNCTELINEDGINFDASSACIGNDGKLYLIADNGVTIANLNGVIDVTVPCNGYVSSLVRLLDGSIGAAAWIDGQYGLYGVNSMGFGGKMPLPENAMAVSGGSGAYEYYYTSDLNCYGYNAAEGKTEKLFNWTGLGVSTDRISQVATVDGSVYYTVQNVPSNDYSSYTTELVKVQRYSEGKAPKRNELVLASAVAGSELQDMVAAYNRTGKNRITLVKFDALGNDEQNVRALNDFAVLNLGGVLPDIIDLNGLSYSELAAAGYLKDLSGYMKGDNGGLIPSIAAVLMKNGAIYQATPGFSIETVVANANVAGGSGTWNYQDYSNSLYSMSSDGIPFGAYATRESMVWNGLGMNMSSLVDWNSYTCNFNNPNFITALQVAKTIPAQIDVGDEYPETLIAANRQLFMPVTLFSFDDVIAAGREFAGNISFVGYPVEEGSGSVINVVPGLAIGSSSKNADAAWDFVKTMLSSDYQSGKWYFPSNAAAFEAGLADAMTEKSYYDAEGNVIKSVRAVVYDSEMNAVEVYAMPAERAQALRTLVDGTTAAFESNETLYEIALSCLSEYFAGNVPVEETVSAIQEQVSVYLNAMK